MIAAAVSQGFAAYIPVASVRAASVTAFTEDLGSLSILFEQPMYGLMATAGIQNAIKTSIGSYNPGKPIAFAVYADSEKFKAAVSSGADKFPEMMDSCEFEFAVFLPISSGKDEYLKVLGKAETNGVAVLDRESFNYLSFTGEYAVFASSTNILTSATGAYAGFMKNDFAASSISFSFPAETLAAYAAAMNNSLASAANDAENEELSTESAVHASVRQFELLKKFETITFGLGYDTTTGITFEASVEMKKGTPGADSISKCTPASADIFGRIPADAVMFSVCEGTLERACYGGSYYTEMAASVKNLLRMFPELITNGVNLAVADAEVDSIAARLDKLPFGNSCTYLQRSKTGKYSIAAQAKLTAPVAEVKAVQAGITADSMKLISAFTNVFAAVPEIKPVFNSFSNTVVRIDDNTSKIKMREFFAKIGELTEKDISHLSAAVSGLLGDEILLSQTFSGDCLRVSIASEISPAFATLGSKSAETRLQKLMPEFKDVKAVEAHFFSIDSFIKQIGLFMLDLTETEEERASGVKSEPRIALETMAESGEGLVYIGWSAGPVMKAAVRIPDSQISAILKIISAIPKPEENFYDDSEEDQDTLPPEIVEDLSDPMAADQNAPAGPEAEAVEVK